MKALLFISIALLTSCVTKQKCDSMFPPQVNTTTTIIQRDSVIQGATVYDTLRLSSFHEYPVDRWVTVKDTAGRAELRFMRDAYGNLIASCEAKDNLIKNAIQYTAQHESQVREVAYIPSWIWMLLGATALLAIPTIIHLLKYILK